MASSAEIKRWLQQLKLTPSLLVLGSGTEVTTDALDGLGGDIVRIRSPMVGLDEIWRRIQNRRNIVVLSDVSPAHRVRIVESFPQCRVAAIEDPLQEVTQILGLVEKIVEEAAPVSNKKAAEKTQITPGHHKPKNYPRFSELCDAICDLPEVTRIRYFKYAGRDLDVTIWPEAPMTGEDRRDIRVRTTERDGIVVSVVCDHQFHMDATVERLKHLLTQYK